MREVYKDIFLNEIELPKNPLRSINNYLVKKAESSLMIDTAFFTEETIARMEEILKNHEIEPMTLKLFLTHLHSDHTGLASWFEERGTKLFMGEVDGRHVNEMVDADSPHWIDIRHFADLQGLQQDELQIEDHPGFKYRPRKKLTFSTVRPGDILAVGDYEFEAIDLQGHTPGILGLYEKKHRLLFCGDHVLGDITPNITFWGFQYDDILGTYFENLKKVREMDIDYLFSSHRALVGNHKQRIDSLFEHHDKRLNEAIKSLQTHGLSTVRDVTKNLSWDIRAKDWDDFPKSQKWFAAGEAHAHLEHLYHNGTIQREEKEGILYYSI